MKILNDRTGIIVGSGLVAILAALVAISAIDSMRRSGYIYDPRVETPNPAIVRERPEELLAEIIARHGGLPMQDVKFVPLPGQEYELPDSVPIAPIKSYEVVSVRVFDNVNPLVIAILDDDPNFGIKAKVEVTFEDGLRRPFILSTWRYSLFLGFTTVSYGDGPPWQWRAAG